MRCSSIIIQWLSGGTKQFSSNDLRFVLHVIYDVKLQDPIRAVVMADRLILIVPDGADTLLEILDRYMQEWVRGLHTNANHIV